jgi:MFS transporter, ENTS family, enterobactin (siderophore) exporter
MRKPEPSRERAQAEQALLGTPLPHGGGLPPALFVNRPFTWLVASVGVSQLGFWAFFVVVLGQAAYRFHAGTAQLGLLLASFSLPFLILTAPLGMVTDRWSPKWFLAAGHIVSTLAVVVAFVAHSLEWLYLASIIDGIGAAAAIPARGSLTALLVDKRSLVQANGMLNTASMLAVIIGPGLSGLLFRHGGQTSVYWFILAALTAGLVLVLPIPDRRPRGGERESFAADLAVGFRLSWREPELRSLLFMAAAAWFLLTVLVTLEPLFVKDVLHRGVDGLGFLWSANGVGAFVGALALTRTERAGGRETWFIGISLVVAGVGYAVYVGTSVYGVAVAGDVVLGVGFAWYLSLSQALIQRVAPEHMRGRVTGVIGMLQEGASLTCSLGIAALGGLVAVQPYLVASGVALTASGFYGLWPLRTRAAEETARA